MLTALYPKASKGQKGNGPREWVQGERPYPCAMRARCATRRALVAKDINQKPTKNSANSTPPA